MFKRKGNSEVDKKVNSRDRSLVKHKDAKPDRSDKAKTASRVRFALEQEPKVDMYFYRIYRKLRLIRYICVLLAALFVMSVPMVYSDHITADNFKYLMKYINLQLSEDAEEYAPFSYEPSESMDFGIYSEDIVVCTDASILFYDKLGNESLRVTFGPYENATMLISKEFVLVYDRGGTEYVIVNNFKLLHRETTSYPIMHCALDDSGYYAVLTSNQNYTSEIQVYNRSFKQTNRIQRDVYVSDLFFTDEHGGFGYTAFTTDAKGEKSGEICIYDTKSQKIMDIRLADIPLRAVASGNTVKVLYADALVWYDQKGAESKRYRFDDQPNAYFLSGQNAVFCFESTNETPAKYSVLLSGLEDEPIRIENTDPIKHVQWHEDRCYLIGTSSLTVYDTAYNAISVTTGLSDMKEILFLPEEKLMGCYSDRTEVVLPADFQTSDPI